MSVAELTPPANSLADLVTVGDLLDAFSDFPPGRIRMRPFPGTATEQDVIDVQAREGRLCELIDGVLVEKTVGLEESLLAIEIARLLGNFVVERKLGRIAGEAGTIRLLPRQVRSPDVAYYPQSRLDGRKAPREPVPEITPDLAVEVLSASNTRAEMDRKLKEYFQAGTRLVWHVDPAERIVDVFTAPDQRVRVEESGTLDGGDVLPGFTLILSELFSITDVADAD